MLCVNDEFFSVVLNQCFSSCARFNSSLTSVRSRRDMTWLWKFAGRKPFWIGEWLHTCYMLKLEPLSNHGCVILHSAGMSGGPGRWMWADGRSVSFSRLRGGASPGRSESDAGSDCVLVENPTSWVSTSCSAETQRAFICSSPAHTHWDVAMTTCVSCVGVIFNVLQWCCSVH